MIFLNMFVSSEAWLSHLCHSKTKISAFFFFYNSHSVLSLCQPNISSYSAPACICIWWHSRIIPSQDLLLKKRLKKKKVSTELYLSPGWMYKQGSWLASWPAKEEGRRGGSEKTLGSITQLFPKSLAWSLLLCWWGKDPAKKRVVTDMS